MPLVGKDPVAPFKQQHSSVILGTEGPLARGDRREAMARNWKPSKEMLPITGGFGLLGALSTATALPFLRHYRKFLKLESKGLGMQLMLSVVFPAMAVSIAHYMSVTRTILGYRSLCPVCLEMRSGALQVLGGVVFPVVLSPGIGIYLALVNVTEAIPNIKDFKETIQFLKKMQKGLGGKMLGLGAVQLAAGMIAVKLEFDCVEKIMEKERREYGYVPPVVSMGGKQAEDLERSVPVPSDPVEQSRYVVRR